ncbi:MAG: holdfast anchor protein HfaD [Hyphomonadaceae bacterium]
MRTVTTLFITTALASAPGAYAQSNNQYNGDDAIAVTEVEAGWTHDAGATAVASGNVVNTTQRDNDTELTSTQHMDGDTSATADATVWTATGNVAITTAAVGNGGAAEIENGSSDIEAEQLAHGDANAATNFTGAYAATTGLSATASGNTAAVSAQNAELRLLMDQESTGSVSADISGDMGVVADQAVSGAIASANNLTVGGETATVLNATRQNATGASVDARSDIYVGEAGDVSGNATANANSVTIDNQWGYVNAAIEQNATSDVSAASYVTLSGEFTGFAAAGAYGVGNQTMASNVGSDMVLDVTQSNTGDVSADAALVAGDGGMALASSAAYGNSITGGLCNDCDLSGAGGPTLTASSNQSNAGDVYSSSVIRSTGAVTVGATSTAIGNTATYQVRPPGG